MSSRPSGDGNSTLQNLAIRLVAGTATHPLEYAKFLIQIGHEPIPPQSTKTLFGKPALALPNVFKYLKHVKSVDGFTGCYRGLGFKLITHSVSSYSFNCTSDFLKTNNILQNEPVPKPPKSKRSSPDDEEEDEDELDDEDGVYDEDLSLKERRIRFLKTLGNNMTCRGISIICSHPFHVITLRVMAQFVGREIKYSGFVGAITGVYRESGIMGYFSGLMPRLLGELVAMVLAHSITFVVRTHVVHCVQRSDQTIVNTIKGLSGFVSSTLTYPYHVVSSCMALSDSGLQAAMPPNMPLYFSWIGCWSQLRAEGQIMRGSSLLWRYYTGPQIIIGGRAIALDSSKAFKPFK